VSTRIPVYFSHSYRREARDLNDYFWTVFCEEGFSFTVDPRSTFLSPTYLEIMMARSIGFVAVVTYRPQVEGYQCSPYIMHEYGLAVQAHKPRLVLIDWRVSPRLFRGTAVVKFNPESYEDRADELRQDIRAFRSRTSPDTAGVYNRAGRVGLALGTGTAEASQQQEIIDRIFGSTGDEAVSLTHMADDPFELALTVDSCDFVILDLDAPGTLQIADFLSGRATPMLKWCRRHAGADSHPVRVFGSAALRRATAADRLALYWTNYEELEARTVQEISRLTEPRRELRTLNDGHQYFRSIGRAALPVFLSNARQSNAFAEALSTALSLENIRYFHYKYRNTIDLGAEFADQLWENVKASAVFVALVDESYWRSPWCVKELELAKKLTAERGLRIVPYFLEETYSGPEFSNQGKGLFGLSQDEQIKTIIEDLDDLLAKTPPSRQETATRGEAIPLKPDQIKVDIAVITILREEYAAVLGLLSRRRPIVGTDTFPNAHSWEYGEIDSPRHQKAYTVVLAQSARAGTNAAAVTTKNTLLAFRPRYILVVGIAGGLREADLGDVVVADRICGYEYGKVDQGFRPRPDHDYPADMPIVSAAGTFADREPNWHLEVEDSLRGLRPRILVGPVASGDKVVDDRSDAFFAEVLKSRPKLIAVEMEGAGVAAAIQDARELNQPVGFGMIRGISDIPKHGRSATAPGLSQSEQTEMRDTWKERASAAAAACAVQLIRLTWPLEPAGQDSA
jgi:nucleoside phosphorylase